jgi:hypothetical protein
MTSYIFNFWSQPASNKPLTILQEILAFHASGKPLKHVEVCKHEKCIGPNETEFISVRERIVNRFLQSKEYENELKAEENIIRSGMDMTKDIDAFMTFMKSKYSINNDRIISEIQNFKQSS